MVGVAGSREQRTTMGLMSGKKVVIFGVANKRSIAWGIAQALLREGAQLALNFQNDRMQESVRKLAADLGPRGIRVNAISAGPIKTVSAMGVADFGALLDTMAQRAPLRRNVDQGDVGNAAAFLLSDLARGITGQTLYVDAGYNI